MTARQLLTRQLEAQRDAVPPREGLVYRNAAEFVLQHGVWMPVHQSLHGEPQLCYNNAIGYAYARGWEYVEGFAMRPLPAAGLHIDGDPDEIFDHAWVRNPKTGRAYEVTWSAPGRGYLGVVFSVVRADDATWNGDACVLRDNHRGYPLFRQPWTGETWDSTTRDPKAMRRLELSAAMTGHSFDLQKVLA